MTDPLMSNFDMEILPCTKMFSGTTSRLSHRNLFYRTMRLRGSNSVANLQTITLHTTSVQEIVAGPRADVKQYNCEVTATHATSL